MAFCGANIWQVYLVSQRLANSLGKLQSKEKFISAATNSAGFGFCSVIFGWDIHDQVYSRELLISNRENGYRDVLAVVDLSTYRRIPWENNVPFFLVSFFDFETKEPLSVCPRNAIIRATKLAEKEGWRCMAGIEYEVRFCIARKLFFKLTPFSQYFQFKGYSPGF